MRRGGRHVSQAPNTFSVGHSYEGTAGVVAVGLLGIAYAAVYLWRGSLMMPIVMHFLTNSSATVLSSVVG